MYTERNSVFLNRTDIGVGELRCLRDGVLDGKSNVVIASPGGTVESLFLARRLFRGRAITTIGSGLVSSAALSVFLLGNRRLATPDSVFFFHQVGYDYEGRVIRISEAFMLAETLRLDGKPQSADELFQHASLLSKLNFVTARLISSRTRIETDRVMEMMDGGGTFLSLGDALEYGFVDDVISRRLIEA